MISPFGRIISDCKELIMTLNTVSFVFVKWPTNKVIDLLVKSVCSYSDRSYSGGIVPTEIQVILIVILMSINAEGVIYDRFWQHEILIYRYIIRPRVSYSTIIKNLDMNFLVIIEYYIVVVNA